MPGRFSSRWPGAVVLSASEIFTFAAVLGPSPNQRVRANRTGSLVGAAGAHNDHYCISNRAAYPHLSSIETRPATDQRVDGS
jgi:hypothetical protein